MTSMRAFAILAVTALFVPTVAFAAPKNLKELFLLVVELVNVLIGVVAALALLFFFWGLAQFILKADSEEGRAQGRQVMIWGIIALFVMFSVWGILNILNNTFFGGSPPAEQESPLFIVPTDPFEDPREGQAI